MIIVPSRETLLIDFRELEMLKVYDAMERNLLIDSDFSAGDEFDGEYELREFPNISKQAKNRLFDRK